MNINVGCGESATERGEFASLDFDGNCLRFYGFRKYRTKSNFICSGTKRRCKIAKEGMRRYMNGIF